MIATDKGFTLLEVLLAITVLGVVVAMLSLSLGGTLRVVEATEQQEAAHHQANNALRRLTADLASALQGGEIAFTGQAGVDGEGGDAEAGEVVATDNTCTQDGLGRLCDCLLEGYDIECPLHQGRFDIRSGEATLAPCSDAIRSYAAKIEDGRVWLRLVD